MKNEIIIYQTNELTESVEVRVGEDTVWLSQKMMSEQFDVGVPAINKHLSNIFESKELIERSVVSILEITAADGKNYKTKFYNLDSVISVGYRVNSSKATQFRIWATHVLKEYLLRGYAVNHRIDNVESNLHDLTTKVQTIELQLKTNLTPSQGIFYDGQVFDAYTFVADIIRSAQKSIILIDNYVDDTVLTLLGKRAESVSACIYTKSISKQLTLDIQRYNSQYPPIDIQNFPHAHDRFLIIDDTELYHIGASLKDLGKKWFAFSKMDAEVGKMLSYLDKTQ